ncbi:MAG: hypothetical protein JWQ54_1562 [Mucilaginibacter sp.]|nr:hypothetical protein [Mucilaginibacter sp.]
MQWIFKNYEWVSRKGYTRINNSICILLSSQKKDNRKIILFSGDKGSRLEHLKGILDIVRETIKNNPPQVLSSNDNKFAK